MFDPQLTAAKWYLDDLNAEALPAFACEALERGHDGSHLRQLAALVNPTKRDVAPLVDAALRELKVKVPLSKDEAAQWTLHAAKTSAASGPINAANLVGHLLTALPELEESYLNRLKSFPGHPGNYEAVFDYLRPAIEEHIARGVPTEFLQRAGSFMEAVCQSGDLEAINVFWIEIFEWLVHSPAGELRFLWPMLGSSTRAKIKEVAFQRGEFKNLPQSDQSHSPRAFYRRLLRIAFGVLVRVLTYRRKS